MQNPTSQKQRLPTMTIILIIVGIFLFLFTVTMIVLFVKTGAIPDTLCTCVFAASGGEFGVMGWIKTTKDRQRERQYEIEDRTYEKDRGDVDDE